MKHLKKAIRLDDGATAFAPYPDAVMAEGLVFTSGARARTVGRGFEAVPASARGKQQGFGLVDRYEGAATEGSWEAHASLEDVLRAAGSDNSQILRQHVWQKDKRFFPCYEAVRIHWQPTPSPSSGLGVGEIPGEGVQWIGLDAIAVAPGVNPRFGERAVLAAVNQAALPSASHYSQAVQSGPLVFTAGHIAIKTSEPGKPVVQGFDDVPPEGRSLATGRSHPDSRDGPIAAQAWYVYKQLEALLARGGMTFADVILSTVYLSDLRDFAVFHRVHRQFFPNDDAGPALCVSAFDEVGHRGCRIEIELTAVDPKSDMEVHPTGWSVPAPHAGPGAVRVGPFVFCAGMVGLGREGQLVMSAADLAPDEAAMVAGHEGRDAVTAAQSLAALLRLKETLVLAGTSLAGLLKLTLYVGELRDLAVFEQVRARVLDPAELPAFECVCVRGPGPVPEANLQLEAIAVL
jgi:enamine deaminase RidA (YjgF/YER057c/UK114 family)